MRKMVVGCLALGLMISAPSVSRASLIALDFTGTTRTAFQAEVTAGWNFSVNSTITVDGMGFFDDFLDDGQGLQQDHLVSLWTVGGVLLTSTTITNASTPVASTAADGEWLFNSISPIDLVPGDYVIGALDPACSGADCDRIRVLGTATTIPEITFNVARVRPGNGFPIPSNPANNDGYFGPTFSIAVPEPATIGLFLFGLAGVGLMMRRRKAVAA